MEKRKPKSKCRKYMQMTLECHFHVAVQGSASESLATQYVNLPLQEKYTERRKAVASVLRQEMNDIKRLVRAAETFPKSSYKRDKWLSEQGLSALRNILNVCENFVYPFLENQGSN